jgi:hypothetical protein
MHLNPSIITGKLEELHREFTALLVLAHQLGTKVEATLDGLATPAGNGIDPDLRAGPLADAIWDRCGAGGAR